MLYLAKLKRANTGFLTMGSTSPLSAVACIYSCYLVVMARLICYTQSHLLEFKSAPRTSIQQLIEEYGNIDDCDVSTHYSEKSVDPGRIDLRAIENCIVDKIDASQFYPVSEEGLNHTTSPLMSGEESGNCSVLKSSLESTDCQDLLKDLEKDE